VKWKGWERKRKRGEKGKIVCSSKNDLFVVCPATNGYSSTPIDPGGSLLPGD